MTDAHQITLERELASGKFSRTYLARERAPGGIGRPIVVKLLQDVSGPELELTDRLKDESRLLAGIAHRHILRVERSVVLDGRPALILEYVNGATCQELMTALDRPGARANGAVVPRAVPLRAALTIGAAVATAMSAINRGTLDGEDAPLNTIHRNIKPANIMVSVDGEVKLRDFLAATFMHSSRTAETHGLYLGTVKYTAPERLSGRAATLAGDVYSLALVLIELLSGEVLPILPQREAGHLAFISERVDRISLPHLEDTPWGHEVRQQLKNMAAFQPTHRPTFRAVAYALGLLAGRASEPTIEAYAATVVHDLVRARDSKPATGELVGRTYEILPPRPSDIDSSAPEPPTPTAAGGVQHIPMAPFVASPAAHPDRESPGWGSAIPSGRPLVISLILASNLQMKENDGAFDILLSHGPNDRRAAEVLAAQLRNDGILPRLRERTGAIRAPPTGPSDQEGAPVAAILVGSLGLPSSEQAEVDAFLRASADAQVVVILLPDAKGRPALPNLPDDTLWVDFRMFDPDPYEALLARLTTPALP